MSQLSTWARFNLLLLWPLVAAIFALTVHQTVQGELGVFRLTVWALESPDAYPRIRSITNERITEQSGLQPGDRLLRAGDVSLRGVGRVRVYAAVLGAAPADRLVPIEFERDGERLETRLDVTPESSARTIRGFVWAIVALTIGPLILLRAPRDPRSLLSFQAFAFYALNQLFYSGGAREITYLWMFTMGLGQLFYAPIFIWVSATWLRRPVARWELILPALVLTMPALRFAWYHEIGLPFERAQAIFMTLDTIELTAVAVYMIHHYRHGDALGRRQIRWVLLGAWLSLIPTAALNLAVAFDPQLFTLRSWAQTSGFVVPLCMFMAIVHTGLFDIDRLLSATASYTLLGIVVLAAVLVLIPQTAQALGPAVGADAATAQLALSIAAAAIIVPANRLLRPWVERLFFAERYALAHGIDELLEALTRCDSPNELASTTGEGLDALLHPDLCAIYVSTAEAFTPVFTRGRAVPPALPEGGSLVRALAEHRTPQLAHELRRGEIALDAADRAALDTLGADVLVPAMRGRSLTFLVCLGTKRSGDIYPPTDLALLARVGDRISAELLRFDDREILEQAQAMQDSLRRYVPGAIAEQLSKGRDLEVGEREVSVLFVDIRGYTSLSESREAHQIFSTVNRYTDAVSRVVQQHGGSVVEFNGDGMMVVFGAPEPLPDKERAAVAAGREIVAAVRAILPAGGAADERPLSVGVGIATGPAYVGNIQAVDRMIWSAIGNTTNLAARLQSLTRELDAAIVIDTATCRKAGEDAADFESREAVTIRGRSEPQTLYLLAL